MFQLTSLLKRLLKLESRVATLEAKAGTSQGVDPETLRELVNSGVLSQGAVTHRDIVAPKVKRLLQEEKFEELAKFLTEYHEQLQSRN